jgi:hypothetical protein
MISPEQLFLITPERDAGKDEFHNGMKTIAKRK